MNYTVLCVSPETFSKAFLTGLAEALGRLRLKAGQLAEYRQGPHFVLRLNADATGELSHERIKSVLLPLADSHRIDLLCLPVTSFLAPKKLVVFDMDSTLIAAEVIDEMARVHGVGPQVKEVTVRAMNGEMDFDQSLRTRLGLLRGMPRAALDDIFNDIKFTPGTEACVRRLHEVGIQTAIVSGGFSIFAERFQKKLGMTYAFANELAFDRDTLTGAVHGEILNAQKKVEIVKRLADELQLPIEQIAAVGDGANDLPMLHAVGLGVGLHGKERVRREAPHLINHGPMTTLLCYLGISYGDV